MSKPKSDAEHPLTNPGKLPEDGSSKGSTPAGLSSEELRRRADDPDQQNDAGTS